MPDGRWTGWTLRMGREEMEPPCITTRASKSMQQSGGQELSMCFIYLSRLSNTQTSEVVRNLCKTQPNEASCDDKRHIRYSWTLGMGERMENWFCFPVFLPPLFFQNAFAVCKCQSSMCLSRNCQLAHGTRPWNANIHHVGILLRIKSTIPPFSQNTER